MTARTLDMVGCRVTSTGTGPMTLGERIDFDGTQTLTFAEHPDVASGTIYGVHVQDGRGWGRVAATYDGPTNTLTAAGPWLTMQADGSLGTSAPSLSGRAFVTCVLRAEDQANYGQLQDMVEASAQNATDAATGATAAAVSAAAAAASAAIADPSSRVQRAGDTMTGPLNLKRATVASHATTADIWTVGNEINWTGTAVTTDLPDAPFAGASRRLFCAGACTFTNNANITVQGGADYVAAAGDIVTIDALTVSTFRATVQRASGLAIAPTPNAPNVVQINQTTVSGTPTSVDISVPTGYFDLTLILNGMSHNNGSNRTMGLSFSTTGTGGSFSSPIDVTAAIAAAASVNGTVKFSINATTAQPVTYTTAGTTGFEAAVAAGTNAIRIGPATGGAYSGNLDAGVVTLIGTKLG